MLDFELSPELQELQIRAQKVAADCLLYTSPSPRD